MIPERWRQIDKLVELTLEQESSARTDFLDKACSGDEELRREVESLLAAHEQAESFIEAPALEAAAKELAEDRTRSLMGQPLGPFKILSLLGSGGMGEVYLARDTRLERTVALKVLPAELVDNPERMKRFVQEAKAASRLNHPNIATIYEVGEAEGIQWIAMEYVEGQTLEWRIGAGADPRVRPTGGGRGGAHLPVNTILDIGMQMSEAVEAAHKKGIIHRDLKPANIMLTAEGRVKVLDFGLAKRVRQETPIEGTVASTDSQTMPGVIVGTVAYMSPEQVLGQEVDHRTDLFSLGVVLYYMASGRLPFGGASPTETIGKILHAEPEPMGRFSRDLPLELERVVRKCLEKDRERRCQSARELLIDLKNLQRDSDTMGKLAAAVSKPKASRSLLWGTALLLTAIAVATGFWFLRPRNETPDASLVAVPFTTYPGLEFDPSFSPDGNQVAFAWTGEKQDNLDIYVKQIGSESSRRLTTDAHDDHYPAWSPDGQSIVFRRRLDDKVALMVIPANGGRERQVAEFRDISGVCWHPGGKWLAVACDQDSADAPLAIFLLSPETGERRRLTSSPRVNSRDPAFSPDGRTLAFVRAIRGAGDIFLLGVSADLLPEGEPKQITFVDQLMGSPAWTPDGNEIIYSSGSQVHDLILWRISASGSGKPKPLPFSGEGTARHPAISVKSHRLAYQLTFHDINIWRCQIPKGEEKPVPPSRLIASTRVQQSAQYSPDGKSVAYAAWASGSGEIWVCDADGGNPLQLTHLGGHMPNGQRWSPDGQNIIFSMTKEGQRNSYMIPAQGGQIKQLKLPFDEYSRDGKWIYFESDRGSVSQIWKRPTEGGEAVQVTQEGGSNPLESTDGKTLFYLKPEDSGFFELWKVPVCGHEERRVIEGILNANFDVKQQGIYYASKPDQNGTPFFLYDFASGKTKRIATIRNNSVEWGFMVSPDEHWILYTQRDGHAQRSDLMLVENFH